MRLALHMQLRYSGRIESPADRKTTTDHQKNALSLESLNFVGIPMGDAPNENGPTRKKERASARVWPPMKGGTPNKKKTTDGHRRYKQMRICKCEDNTIAEKNTATNTCASTNDDEFCLFSFSSSSIKSFSLPRALFRQAIMLS